MQECAREFAQMASWDKAHAVVNSKEKATVNVRGYAMGPALEASMAPAQ
jgi:hypothetical protein